MAMAPLTSYAIILHWSSQAEKRCTLSRHLLLHDVQIQGETAAELQAREHWLDKSADRYGIYSVCGHMSTLHMSKRCTFLDSVHQDVMSLLTIFCM